MSRGLGKLEHRIMDAMQQQTADRQVRGELLCQLGYLLAGCIDDLEDTPNFTRPQCRHKDTVRCEGGEYIDQRGHDYFPCPSPTGDCYFDCHAIVGWINQHQVIVPAIHESSCYRVPPSHAWWVSMARATRSLERKGLLKSRIEGSHYCYPTRYKRLWLPDAYAIWTPQHQQEQKAKREKKRQMTTDLIERLRQTTTDYYKEHPGLL